LGASWISEKPVEQPSADATADLNRVLEAARLLFAVLTPEELENLRLLIEGGEFQKFKPVPRSQEAKTGNTGVT
jgi:hypothetical protein